jgi:hypothetical protein
MRDGGLGQRSLGEERPLEVSEKRKEYYVK